jgi:hypothetical protein
MNTSAIELSFECYIVAIIVSWRITFGVSTGFGVTSQRLGPAAVCGGHFIPPHQEVLS